MKEVKALTLGSHGETMVPAPSQCTVNGEPLTNLLSQNEIESLVEKTSNGGAEIVALLKTGSAYFAPSSAAATMVKAIITDSMFIKRQPKLATQLLWRLFTIIYKCITLSSLNTIRSWLILNIWISCSVKYSSITLLTTIIVMF